MQQTHSHAARRRPRQASHAAVGQMATQPGALGMLLQQVAAQAAAKASMVLP